MIFAGLPFLFSSREGACDRGREWACYKVPVALRNTLEGRFLCRTHSITFSGADGRREPGKYALIAELNKSSDPGGIHVCCIPLVGRLFGNGLSIGSGIGGAEIYA
jgi:hypothetical protein